MPWPDLCLQPKKGFRRAISRLCWGHQAKHLIRNARPLENTSRADSLQNRSFVQSRPLDGNRSVSQCREKSLVMAALLGSPHETEKSYAKAD